MDYPNNDLYHWDSVTPLLKWTLMICCRTCVCLKCLFAIDSICTCDFGASARSALISKASWHTLFLSAAIAKSIYEHRVSFRGLFSACSWALTPRFFYIQYIVAKASRWKPKCRRRLGGKSVCSELSNGTCEAGVACLLYTGRVLWTMITARFEAGFTILQGELIPSIRTLPCTLEMPRYVGPSASSGPRHLSTLVKPWINYAQLPPIYKRKSWAHSLGSLFHGCILPQFHQKSVAQCLLRNSIGTFIQVSTMEITHQQNWSVAHLWRNAVQLLIQIHHWFKGLSHREWWNNMPSGYIFGTSVWEKRHIFPMDP